MTFPVVGPDPHTPQWEDLRFYNPDRDPPVVFGASEIAAVCGLSKYETPRHIFHRKRREIPPKEQTLAMKRGTRFEAGIIDEYREARPEFQVVSPMPMFFHPTHRFLAATPDATAVKIPERAEPFKGIPVDAKWIGWRRVEEFGEYGTDELPDDILMQAQQQMLVLGAEFQETAVMLGGEEFRIYRVEANDVLQKAILTAAQELCERIVRNDPPEHHWTHPETPTLIKELYKVGEEVIHLSEETALWWNNRQRLLEEIKAKEAEAEQLKARVLDVLGNAAAGILPRRERALVRKQVNVAAHQRKATSYVKLSEGDATPWLDR